MEIVGKRQGWGLVGICVWLGSLCYICKPPQYVSTYIVVNFTRVTNRLITVGLDESKFIYVFLTIYGRNYINSLIATCFT